MGRMVAIYARVSTEHEAQISALENQVQYYDEILKRHPDWTLYDRYIDEGITGTSIKKRPNFLRMIRDAENGCFDLIITREVSRFARNTVDTLQQTRELKKIGVEVYFTEDNIWTFKDDDGELKLTLMATLAQNESKKISQRVKAGQRITFLNGVFYGSGNILGYDKVGKDMIINPEQAKVVRLMYDMYLSGKGLKQIKDELERRGMTTSTGLKIWNCSNISRILKNPFYSGTIVYRKSYIPDFLEQKHKINHGEVEQIIVEGRHEPIVTKEEYQKVLAIMGDHNKHNTKKKQGGIPKTVWTKKLQCSCNSSMQQKRYHKRKDGTITYCYQCYNQIHTGSYNNRLKKGLSVDGICQTNIVQQWKLKVSAYFVFDKLWLEKSEIIESMNKIIEESITVEDEVLTLDIETKECSSRIKKIESKLEKLLDTYLSGILNKDDYVLKKAELEKEKVDLEIKLTNLRNKNVLTSKTVKERIDDLKKIIKENLDYKRGTLNDELIETFVDKIVVYNDKLEWHLNYLNDIIKNKEGKESNESNTQKILIAKYCITLDDIIEYTRYDKELRGVKAYKPFIVEIYI